jgi:hypothetical protein
VAGMVYSVGVWTCGGMWVHVVVCELVWVYGHVMCGQMMCVAGVWGVCVLGVFDGRYGVCSGRVGAVWYGVGG